MVVFLICLGMFCLLAYATNDMPQAREEEVEVPPSRCTYGTFYTYIDGNDVRTTFTSYEQMKAYSTEGH